jgi:hypothetical protein
MTETAERRTKRRYAHELYPHPGEYDVRPLAVDVPYLYAQALGLEVWGTGWFDAFKRVAPQREATDRTLRLLAARRLAFTADALSQDMVGDEAWAWAEEYGNEESGELVWDRAVAHGVKPHLIKPYLCGPEPDCHDHFTDQELRQGIVTRIEGPESACPLCTEPVIDPQQETP